MKSRPVVNISVCHLININWRVFGGFVMVNNTKKATLTPYSEVKFTVPFSIIAII